MTFLIKEDGVDYEYGRAGTASIFMFCEPLASWRQASAREQRTKSDWTVEVAHWQIRAMQHAKQSPLYVITSTHISKGAFYEVFPPAKAKAYVQRINSKHGSWLNVAENELSAMTRQCLKKSRISTLQKLQAEIKAWSIGINQTQCGVDWQMKIGDARIKLKSIYPVVKT